MKTALILIVGNKYTRALKAIEYVYPDIVYFIRDEKYKKYQNRIIEESNRKFDIKEKIIVDFQSIDETYNASKEIFDELKTENCDIKVVLSNGTKAMVSGLVLASVGFDCELLYVGSDSFGRDHKGETIEGHEEVLSIFNPMKKQATLEISKGKRYFNRYQFDDAIENFQLAKEVLDDKKLVDIYIKLANLFKYWDKFDDFVIYNHPSRGDRPTRLNYYLTEHILKVIRNDDDLVEYFLTKEKLFYDQLKFNARFLNRKINYSKKKCFINKTNIFYYLVDLMNNASRRIEKKKYDDATARLYRSSELIAQIRLLNEFDLIDENNLKEHSIFHIDKLKLIDTKNLLAISYVANVLDFRDTEKKTVRLSLKQDYNLLYYLDDELAKDFLEDDIQNLLSTRNNSILAHGLNPAKKEDTINFLKAVEKYARETSIVDPFEFDKYYEYSKFPKFKDIEL